MFYKPTRNDTGVPCNGIVSHIRGIADQGSTRNFYFTHVCHRNLHVLQLWNKPAQHKPRIDTFLSGIIIIFLMTHLFSLSMKLINIIMEEVIAFLWMVILYSHVIIINCYKSFCSYLQRETLCHTCINELINSHYNMKIIKEVQQVHQTV